MKQSTVTVLFDSLCPVCSSEVRLLKRFDGNDNLKMVDIAAKDFDPSRYGLSVEECVGSMRGIDASGKALDGMDTIRAMYSAVGLGWLMTWTRMPIIRRVCDWGSLLFAKIRPRISSFDPSQCDTDRCRLKRDSNE